MDKDISPIRVTCFKRTDGVFELVKSTSHCHLVTPHTEHSELIIIPKITNAHYGLEKKKHAS